jgi:hypothetical protein
LIVFRRQKERETMQLRNPFKKILLNDGEPTGELDPKEMAARLKSAMTTLKGAFIDPERGRVIAPYLNRDEDRKFIERNAETLKVEYQDYDWRLNRD